jgi:hypothetical protein
MSIFSSILGLNKTPHTPVDGQIKTATDQSGADAGQDRNQFLSLMGGGQNALNTSVSSAMSAAMPSFMNQMQNVQESGVRRGISTGDLGTSTEGDLASAFQRNESNAAGQQAMSMFGTQLGASSNMYNSDQNRFLQGLQGQQDYATAQANAKKQKSASLFGGLGAAVGGFFGGAPGAAAGSAIGAGIGG